ANEAPRRRGAVGGAGRTTVRSDEILIEITGEEAAVAGGSPEYPVGHDDPAAGHRDGDLAGDLHSLVGGVIHVHVVGADAQRLAGGRVVDHDVGVGAGRDDSL